MVVTREREGWGEVDNGKGRQTYNDRRTLDCAVNTRHNMEMMYYRIIYIFIVQCHPDTLNLKKKNGATYMPLCVSEEVSSVSSDFSGMFSCGAKSHF